MLVERGSMIFILAHNLNTEAGDICGSLHNRFVMGAHYVQSPHVDHVRRGIDMLTDLLRYDEHRYQQEQDEFEDDG